MLTAPNSATPDATAPTNVTRSATDTRSRRASRALSRHECAHLPPALPQRLKTPYSESGEAKRESGEAHSRDARSHETKHTALHQGTHGCTRTLGQATRRGGVNTPQTSNTSHTDTPPFHPRNSPETHERKCITPQTKAPRRWCIATGRALTERVTVSHKKAIITHPRDARTTAPQRGSRQRASLYSAQSAQTLHGLGARRPSLPTRPGRQF